MGTECLQGHLWTENGKGLKKYPSPPAPPNGVHYSKSQCWWRGSILGLEKQWPAGSLKPLGSGPGSAAEMSRMALGPWSSV